MVLYLQMLNWGYPKAISLIVFAELFLDYFNYWMNIVVGFYIKHYGYKIRKLLKILEVVNKVDGFNKKLHSKSSDW